MLPKLKFTKSVNQTDDAVNIIVLELKKHNLELTPDSDERLRKQYKEDQLFEGSFGVKKTGVEGIVGILKVDLDFVEDDEYESYELSVELTEL